ncbi:unnamed protein product [Caenorhabditis nigoni]
MKKDDTNATLAEEFVRNHLYNSLNYNFADVTQAINVPYGSTNQYESNILNFGDANGLSWIENNIDPPAAGSRAIVIVVGYSENNNPGGTMFTKSDLTAQGYVFMAVSLGGDLFGISDNDWDFKVNQSNGQDIANQISYILCNL